MFPALSLQSPWPFPERRLSAAADGSASFDGTYS
jgi:hypothetical protein